MNYKNKKVLILGLGLNEGGVGSAKFFARQGAKVKVTDLKVETILKSSLDQLKAFPEIEFVLGEHKNEDIDWADLVIRNPALRPNNPYLKYAKEQGKHVEMDMGIFLEFVKKEQLIGVTGTKGKSTTSALIYEAIRHSEEQSDVESADSGRSGSAGFARMTGGDSGKKVIHIGNIGKSVLDAEEQITEDTLVVLEVSSFQLEAFDEHKVSPKYAVITNIYPDHLNYYQSLDEYTQSKKLIAKNQTEDDFLFLWKDDKVTSILEFLKGIKSKIIYFSVNDLPESFSPKLKGEHNLRNFAAALAVVKQLDISEEQALKVFEDFQGVDFRMQLIKQWNGVKIINDTAATTPEAAIEALKSYPNSILIAGGMNKGLDYKEFARAIDQYAKEVYFIEGDATSEISKFKIQNSKFKGIYSSVRKILESIKQTAQPSDVILFSPGATSFNFWQNEFDRGRKFNQAVEEVFR